ncbi:hypothetical protein QGN17_09390 [Sphingomonas sp. MAHUQ-71]|uniref:Uncharacterized protein n=1 Tax=Sphingomonas oryzagri TaxID=3042314 RepID=A0ABT6N1I7_9SPHN|nr:hypothetical protein [Sphingomonas oryzagri]
MKHLVALGMSGEALTAAIAEMQAAEDTRSVGAKRQQRYRDRLNAKRNEVSQNVTRDDSVTAPAPSPSPNEILNPNPTPTRESITPAREGPPNLPVGASAEQWAGFVEMRRRIRKPLTARAQQLALRKLSMLAENGQPPGAVLDQSTLNGWQDLFPLKDARNGHRNSNHQGNRSNDGFLEALREVGGR